MRFSRRSFLALVAAIVIGAVAPRLVPHFSTPTRVRFSTTTSLYATGLLEHLAKEYQRENRNISIDYIPVGTGAALRLAEENSVDGVFVHAPELEAKYLARGIITFHRVIAYNYFCIVGPREDPAGVSHAGNVVEAFKRIWEAGVKGEAVFVSRGDWSGTHVRELTIWKLAGLRPEPGVQRWYLETGQGMAETLIVAENLEAYTLSDTGTFYKLKLEGRLPRLEILYTGDPLLLNIYSVYLTRARLQSTSGIEAKRFIEFIVAHPELINEYDGGVGHRLFNAADEENISWLQRAWEAMAREEWGKLYEIVPHRGLRRYNA